MAWSWGKESGTSVVLGKRDNPPRLFFLNTLVLLGSSYTDDCSEKKDFIDSTDLFLFLPTGIKS